MDSGSVSSPPVPICIHLEKTGGMTVRDIIARQHPQESVYAVNEGSFSDASFTQRIADQRLQAKFGHFGFGLHKQIDRPCRYITMVRYPIERMVSGFHYSRQIHPSGGYFHEITLEQLVAEPGRDNGQTRRLSGHGRLGDRDPYSGMRITPSP
jgi:hypothetical protein